MTRSRAIRRLCQLLPLSLGGLLCVAASAVADPVTVRFPEGTTHGFLVLRSVQSGQTLAHGELQSAVHGDRMESRLTWRFRDGSLQDELMTYSQRPVLKLLAYRQIQREPNGYEIKQRERDKKDADEFSGTLELPDDVYNGMTATILNNLKRGEIATGHVVAFTPKPRLVKQTMRPVGEDPIVVGESRRTATRYLVDLEVGGIAGVFAKVAGKEPLDLKFWVLPGSVPAFVGFEGPFFLNGPAWRIELSSPRWPK